MSAASEMGRAAAMLAADIVGGLIESAMGAKADRVRAEKIALDKLLARPNPRLFGEAYKAAKARARAEAADK